MISYCIAVYRPVYARLLLAELVRKTSVPFEILLWLNVADPTFETQLDAMRTGGMPLRIVGRSPGNIGMAAYRPLFAASRHGLVVQIDDDVVAVSPGVAQRADRLFRRHPGLRMLVADVWQDEFTTGARPEMSAYRAFDAREGLYSGPVDGWFAVYHRSVLPLLSALPSAPYFSLGAVACQRLEQRGFVGALDLGMRVFHVIGPAYAQAFGMLDFEIAKYRRLGRADIVDWYERERAGLPPADALTERVALIHSALSAAPA
ncbi:hypothetical protein [Xylophilus sp. GOD-11R]|uniref:hypothetical protein n=1 Tax=Xylophilus sp. GOD-11R TaxID=3089814 RepID=UPI00298D1353|nr:hypothetical protein [Xylophilus sp. GOD-11R]WPB55016.1 hypothetical protein R9X41_12635 [Xylophilus sp. GOD-11R]